jgi:hypothetical protein
MVWYFSKYKGKVSFMDLLYIKLGIVIVICGPPFYLLIPIYNTNIPVIRIPEVVTTQSSNFCMIIVVTKYLSFQFVCVRSYNII